MADRYDMRLADLERRVSNTVIIGTVSQVDHEKNRYRLKSGEIESDWIPKTERRAGKTKEYDSFEEGEQIIAIAQSGDLSQAVIVGAVATEKTQAANKGNVHRTVYPDGTTMEYDHEAKRFKMDVAEGGSFQWNIGGGVTLVAEGGKLTIKAPGGTVLETPSYDVNP